MKIITRTQNPLSSRVQSSVAWRNQPATQISTQLMAIK